MCPSFNWCKMGIPYERSPHFTHATYFISRESTEKYGGTEFPERKSSPDVETNLGAQSLSKSINVETNPCNYNNININKTDFCLNVDTNSAKEVSEEKTKEVELKQKFKLEFMVDPEFMKKLERIKSRLSRKYPQRVNFEMLFTIVMEEYLERHSPENKIKRREKRKAKRQKKQAFSQNKETQGNKQKIS